MSNFTINNIESFSFDESYSATHGYVNEFPELENSIISHANPIPPHANPIPPHANPIPPHANPIPPHTNPIPPHANPIPPHANPIPPHANPIPPHANPIPPHANPIPPHANPIPPHANPIAPAQNNNNPNDEMNMLYRNIATLISKHFAQKYVQFPNNINGQNDGQGNSNGPVRDNNQINNDPAVRMKRIFLNQ